MPSFLQSTFLAGLAALAVPLLIHLFFRLRTKRVDLGTIRFLRLVLEENARRRKVMRWFLLALRMACVALLVGLFARPYFSHAASISDRPLHVLLIDRSATMGLTGDGPRPIDQAISDVRALLAKWGEDVELQIAFFDDTVSPLVADSGNQFNEALQKEAGRTNLSGGTSFGAAMAWARDALANGPAGPRQLHLFTDLQRSGLDWTDGESLPPGVEVHLHNYARSVVNNVAATEVRTPRTWIRPGESASLSATISHDGGFALEAVPVVLELGRIPADGDLRESRRTGFAALSNRITMRERVKLEPGANIPVEFPIPELAEGEWQGRVAVEYDDELAFDNSRYFAISSASSYRILVVSAPKSATAALSESHFLEAALRLGPPGEAFAASPFSVESLELDPAARFPSLSPFAAVVLANVPDVKAGDAERLADYVRGGGGLVMFSGDQVVAGSMQELGRVGLTCGTPGPTMVTRDLPWRIDSWDRSHELFAPFEDPQTGDLRRLIFAAYTKLVPQSEARVLAKFRNGDPFLLERTVGAGTVLTVTTSCGREWSDWATTRLFLPVVHQLLGYEVGLTAGGRVRQRLIGVDPALGTGQPAKPLGTTASPAQAALIPGVEQNRAFLLVTNSNPKESETEACSPADFEDRFALKFVAEDGGNELVQAERAAEHKDEQWPWVACLLLAVLLLESFVGNRTTA